MARQATAARSVVPEHLAARFQTLGQLGAKLAFTDRQGRLDAPIAPACIDRRHDQIGMDGECIVARQLGARAGGQQIALVASGTPLCQTIRIGEGEQGAWSPL
jgi:hypothetical protein